MNEGPLSRTRGFRSGEQVNPTDYQDGLHMEMIRYRKDNDVAMNLTMLSTAGHAQDRIASVNWMSLLHYSYIGKHGPSLPVVITVFR